ncbi:NAC transcription factor 47-like [Elaeis guineensis]|uniref:NAC transcription factor 47-like n=1 Tax=Elaeis guineensis var. tenera TaxID=51953 RepID=UPI003C6CDAC8
MDGEVDGMRFLPTDVEVIRFLQKRVEGSPLPPKLMHECDVYAQEPWNLPRDFMRGIGEEVYYFTPRHKASANGSGCRANRNAGQGFWHGNGRDQLIFDESLELIGHKTSLVFKFRDSKRKRLHHNWIMHEYLLHSPDGKI